jgi:hypothetical protein
MFDTRYAFGEYFSGILYQVACRIIAASIKKPAISGLCSG